LSASLPSVGFDAWGSNGAGSMTLATVWSSNTDYSEIIYSQTTKTLEWRITSGHSIRSKTFTGIWLSKQDRLDIVMSHTGNKSEITIAIPQSGSNPKVQSGLLTIAMPSPKQIRLSNSNQTTVVPLEWYAVHVHSSKYLDVTERLELLRLQELWTI
jgi:hypothetical protein